MRIDSKNKHNNLHWHDGSTCHGSPTLQECLKEAIAKGWVGKVLKRDDEDADKYPVSCYSLIASSFDHWENYGTYVAVVEITSRLI